MLYNVNNNANRITQEDSMRRAFSFLIGTLMGSLIGAALALLFTPTSGVDLRMQITDRFGGLAADIRNAANTRRIELQERLETLRAPRE
jgi:gas vesicle protein